MPEEKKEEEKKEIPQETDNSQTVKEEEPLSTVPQKSGLSTGAKVGIGIGIGCFILLVVTIVLSIYFIKRNTSKIMEELSKVENQQTTQEKSQEEKKEYAMNEDIEINGATFRVNSFTPYTPVDEYDQAPQGKRRVMVGVTITNTGNQSIYYSSLDFQVEDSNGNRVFDTFASNVPEQLQGGELISGGKISGNMVFDVPSDDNNLKLVYKPSFISSNKIFFIRLK